VSFQPQSATMLRTSGHRWAEYAPHPALSRWVSSYWTLETERGNHVVRTLPDACIDLTLRFGQAPAAYLAGAQRRARRWNLRGKLHLLGARLLPGAAPLLGIDAGRLRDEWIPLDDILPRAVVARLVRSASRAPDARERVAVLEAFLSERLLNREPDPRLSRAIQVVFAQRGDISVTQLARISGAHARTLRRLFEQWIGLPPKRFLRIVRLQTALRALPTSNNWARVAAELGYHDQAHFVHDVRELFGATPRELVELAPRTR
jgi:AraC-like DNA-binding protein